MQTTRQDAGRKNSWIVLVAVTLILGVLYISYNTGDVPTHLIPDGQQHYDLQNDPLYGEPRLVDPLTDKKKVLLTGGAGFIGSHCVEHLLRRGDDVVLVDEMNDYYNVSLKEVNLRLLQAVADNEPGAGRLTIHQKDIADHQAMEKIFKEELERGSPINFILHLAARAGVRPSIKKPALYVHSNVAGSLVLFELARQYPVVNFVMASSSSVYGESAHVPFTETDDVSYPVSPYAATKKSMELMAHTYHHLYKIPMSAVRYFTVYGPRGRPDMAPYGFIDSIYRGRPVKKFGSGHTSRDYTYVDDIVQGTVAALDRPFTRFQLFNLGNSRTVDLNEFIATVEQVLGREAKITQMDMQPGDVPRTFANLTKSERLLGYSPQITVQEGLRRTAAWYVTQDLPSA
eukprot:TRINITY_DN1705_c0_g1_i6.p1 TRINITY_DN1705_c0_g1~~TRINITY_DN1705_c0_g1_i6.p1  ORF type:complete len:401 (-),score=58.43 TRINITY_DN1705_c0_g1_i6:34-1236(-)